MFYLPRVGGQYLMSSPVHTWICTLAPTITGNASDDITHPLSAVQAVYGSEIIHFTLND